MKHRAQISAPIPWHRKEWPGYLWLTELQQRCFIDQLQLYYEADTQWASVFIFKQTDPIG